jgi:hypothetical protein
LAKLLWCHVDLITARLQCEESTLFVGGETSNGVSMGAIVQCGPPAGSDTFGVIYNVSSGPKHLDKLQCEANLDLHPNQNTYFCNLSLSVLLWREGFENQGLEVTIGEKSMRDASLSFSYLLVDL